MSDVAIPGSVTSIGTAAFQFCTQLAAITVPDSVTNLGDFAFSYCSSLTNAILPRGLTSIGKDVFQVCTQLANVMIPDTLLSIGSSWAANLSVVVEASSNLSTPAWIPISTNALVDGNWHFNDLAWTNLSSRFYRARSL